MCDAGVERDVGNNPLGAGEPRLVGGVQKGVRKPLLLGGLGCTMSASGGLQRGGHWVQARALRL